MSEIKRCIKSLTKISSKILSLLLILSITVIGVPLQVLGSEIDSILVSNEIRIEILNNEWTNTGVTFEISKDGRVWDWVSDRNLQDEGYMSYYDLPAGDYSIYPILSNFYIIEDKAIEFSVDTSGLINGADIFNVSYEFEGYNKFGVNAIYEDGTDAQVRLYLNASGGGQNFMEYEHTPSELQGFYMVTPGTYSMDVVPPNGYSVEPSSIKVEIDALGKLVNDNVDNNGKFDVTVTEINPDNPDKGNQIYTLEDKGNGLGVTGPSYQYIGIENVEVSVLFPDGFRTYYSDKYGCINVYGLRSDDWHTLKVNNDTLPEYLVMTENNGLKRQEDGTFLFYSGIYGDAGANIVCSEPTAIINLEQFSKYSNSIIKDNSATFELHNERGELLEVLETNSDGYFTSQELNIGNYYIVQTFAPNGYLINEEVIEVTITEEDEKVSINIYNDLILGEIELNITNYENEYLEGTEIGMYANEDILIEGEVKYLEGELVQQLVSTDAVLKEELPLGTYYILEQKASTGYINRGRKHYIELTYVDQYTDSIVEVIDIKYYQNSLYISVESDYGFAWDNIEFILESENHTIIINEDTHIKNGNNIIVEGLESGEYRLHQSSTTRGFILLDDVRTFTVREDGYIEEMWSDSSYEVFHIEPNCITVNVFDSNGDEVEVVAKLGSEITFNKTYKMIPEGNYDLSIMTLTGELVGEIMRISVDSKGYIQSEVNHYIELIIEEPEVEEPEVEEPEVEEPEVEEPEVEEPEVEESEVEEPEVEEPEVEEPEVEEPEVEELESDSVTHPTTSDSTSLFWLNLLVLSLAGFLLIIRKRNECR